jgi:hypothetical protein
MEILSLLAPVSCGDSFFVKCTFVLGFVGVLTPACSVLVLLDVVLDLGLDTGGQRPKQNHSSNLMLFSPSLRLMNSIPQEEKHQQNKTLKKSRYTPPSKIIREIESASNADLELYAILAIPWCSSPLPLYLDSLAEVGGVWCIDLLAWFPSPSEGFWFQWLFLLF